MDQPILYEKLTAIFKDVFLRDNITLRPETKASDIPGWDSFKQIEIVMTVEEQFDIKLTTRELDSLKCVGDLARYIEMKLGPSASH